MIYVGIDDTDTADSPGTNQLARFLVRRLPPDYESVVVVRHQLLFHPRIPYTRKNSSASILITRPATGSVEEVAARLRRVMRERFVEGSDPGLCVTDRVPAEIVRFGRRCQREVVRRDEASRLAAEHDVLLEGLGGTHDGVIGALAAVGLLAEGNDGRVVHIGHWPDDLSGWQDVALLARRGLAEIRCVESGRSVASGRVDVGKHLRPNYRNGRIVLFVAPATQENSHAARWRAVRFT